MILFIGPILTVVILTVLLVVAKIPSLLGVPVTIAIYVVVIGGGLAVDTYLMEVSKPRAVRVAQGTVEIRTFRGREIRVSMGDITLVPSGRPGWGVIRVGNPAQRGYFLEPKQYDAIRAVAPLRQ